MNAQAQAQTPRQPRELENLIERARKVEELLATACSRTSDMKLRLLGIGDPNAVPTPAGRGPTPQVVTCELSTLSALLNRFEEGMERLHSNITDLERV